MAVNNQHAKSGRYLRENGKHINLADFIANASTQFNELKVASKISQLNFNSDLPLSERRDVITEVNGATVTQEGPEYRLRATSETDSKATLRTAQRGNYQSGSVFEAGSGFRLVGTPTGTAYFKNGYANNGNGIEFIYDADGYAFIVSNQGVEERIDQQDWNLDRLDGSLNDTSLSDAERQKNPSGYTFDVANGHVFQTPFVYYGYGAILFEIEIINSFGITEVYPVHIYQTDGRPAIEEPNLPLRQEVFSGDGGSQLDLYVGGRQFSVWGQADDVERTVGAYRLEQDGIGTTFYPLISFRIKSSYEQIPLRLAGVSLLSTANLVFEIRRKATLTGASFETPGNHTASEIASEWDTSATAVTGGETIFEGLAPGGQGAISAIQSTQLPNRPISEFDTYTLCVRRVSGTNATVSANLRVTEDW